MTIRELHALYRQKEKSPVETFQETLSQIDRWQHATHLLTSMDEEAGLKAARASEARYFRGEPLSVLDGMLVGLKDLIDVEGVVTTAGSAVRAHEHPAAADAPVTRKLRASGANIALGKLNLHEFAYGPTGNSSHYGPVANPYNLTHMAGGSSSGSAVAVATGLFMAALGTDTGGSIRIPSAFVGISGLKPTYGTISTEGVIPLSWSLDHVGPMARHVEDVRRVFEVLSDQSSLEGGEVRRVLWPEGLDCADAALDPVVQDGIGVILDSLGVLVERGPLPDLERIWLAQSIILGSEALAYHWTTLDSQPERYQPDVADRLYQGGAHLAAEYIAALRYRQAAQTRYRALFDEVDLLILPTVPVQAPPLDGSRITTALGHEDVRAVLTRFTNPFNLLGFPALAIPWGMHQGLPVSIQLVAAPGREALLLGVGEAIQQQFPSSVPEPPPALA